MFIVFITALCLAAVAPLNAQQTRAVFQKWADSSATAVMRTGRFRGDFRFAQIVLLDTATSQEANRQKAILVDSLTVLVRSAQTRDAFFSAPVYSAFEALTAAAKPVSAGGGAWVPSAQSRLLELERGTSNQSLRIAILSIVGFTAPFGPACGRLKEVATSGELFNAMLAMTELAHMLDPGTRLYAAVGLAERKEVEAYLRLLWGSGSRAPTELNRRVPDPSARLVLSRVAELQGWRKP